MFPQKLYGITLGHINIFLTAAKCGSFTQAAHDLSLTQSAVSKAVVRLERALDLPLFQRSYRRVSLTQAGRSLYDRWSQSLAEIGQSYDMIRRAQLSQASRLRIGATNTTNLALYFWPLINRFMQSHSDVRLEFDSDNINRLVEKLLSARLDLIFIPDFMHYTIERNALRWRWAAKGHAQAILPQEHPLADIPLSLASIKDEKIAVLDEDTPDNARWLRDLFHARGYQLHIGQVFNSPESIAHFYRQSDGILLSDQYFDYGPNDGVLLKKPLSDVENGIICAWDPANCPQEALQFLQIMPPLQAD